MGNPRTVCWDWALSPTGLLILAVLFAVPLVWSGASRRSVPAVEAGLIGLLAVFIAMGGCKGLVLTGWLS